MRLFGCEEKVSGRDRQVFVFKDFVIKLPRTESWLSFVRGLCSNLKEIETVTNYDGLFPDQIMEIKWSGFFGIVLVVKRYQEVRDVSEHRCRFFNRLERIYSADTSDWKFIWDEDNKVFNYGWDKYGRLVKLDIGVYY